MNCSIAAATAAASSGEASGAKIVSFGRRFTTGPEVTGPATAHRSVKVLVTLTAAPTAGA
jgi:hypothetical protein